METQGNKREKTIFSFFKPRESTSTSQGPREDNIDIPDSIDQHPSKSQRVEIDVSSLERDPGIRIRIWQNPVNQRDDIRRSYIKMGPYQPNLPVYPRIESGRQYRRFQSSWFKQFPWLEYSPSKDATFCFPCFLFENKKARYLAFTTEGFRSWKRVNNGNSCSLLMHMGGPTSPHNNAVRSIDTLMNVTQHIDKVMNAQTSEEVRNNRLRLMATIESIRWLSMQACALRGHDESSSSNNRDNFIEMVRLMGRMNVDIDGVVLDKAPQNAKYTSTMIQKEILHILANRVRSKIRHEVGDAKFCILVDEAKDISSKEQMAIVLRFVEHHYRFAIFKAVIDFQVEELNSRFNEGAVELLMLSSALEPRDNIKLFQVDHICSLAENFYPGDFNEHEMHYLRSQLEHYKVDILRHEKFQNMSTISELCQRLFETNKSEHYNLIDRLIRLVLTLPVSTATTERSFSAMKHVKSALRNKMEEEFLADSLIVYIERELVESIYSDSIIDEFYSLKHRRAQLQ